jgi:tartrate-resistant acid phosphatase type 5
MMRSLFLFVISGITLLSVGAVRSPAQISKVENQQPVPAFNEAERLQGNALSFLVIGDWGTGGKGQKRVAAGMLAKYARDGALAVLTTGNNFYEAGVESADDSQWEMKFEAVYPREKFDIPFYATLGERDYRGDPDAQLKYSGKKLANGTASRWRMPGRFWTKVFTSNTFSIRIIGIDTEQLLKGTAEQKERQLARLDSILAKSGEEWKVVIGHHPVYSNGQNGNSLGMIRSVKPVLEKHHADMYVSGHDLDLEWIEPVNGVQYVVSGGGSGSRDVRYGKNTRFAATNMGFVWFEVSGKEMLLQFLDADGKVIFAQRLPKQTGN